ncbi:Tryptophan biosynthesis protein trp1, partial [Globisporangium splendens]
MSMSAKQVESAVKTEASSARASPTKKKQRVDASASSSAGSSALLVVAAATSSSSAPSAAPSTPSGGGKPVAKSKFCINCQKELTRNIRITCIECISPTTQLPLIELCVECFAVGIELGNHKKTHKYTVSDCLAYSVVRESQAYLQNMKDTANAPSATSTPQKDSGSSAGAAAGNAGGALLASDWTADEELLLLEGIEMFGMGNWKDIAEHVGTKSEKKCEAHYMGAYLSTIDLMPRFLDDPEAPNATEEKKVAAANGAIQPTTASDAIAPATPATGAAAALSANPGSELAGYMPLRGDFDVEYDNEAELILADMEFSEDDHPTERELKLKVIEIYNSKLDERERRKRFVIERGMLDYKRHQQSERRRPKDERELIAQMRPFARFQTPKEHDDFVNGLVTAMRLRKQILLLQEYRKNGVRTLAEAELYDQEKKKREVDQALQKQRDNAPYLYESGRPVSSGRDRANRWLNRDQGVNGSEAPSDKNVHDQDHPRTRGSAAPAGPSLTSSFLIDGTPGSHLLTPQEKELCSKLKLLPKDALVRECYRLGYLSKKTAKEIVKIGHIYDFFVKCGWVQTENAAPKAGSVSPECCQWQHHTFAEKKNEGRMSILDVITEQRRADVAAARLLVSEQQLRDRIRATETALGPALDVLGRLNAPVKQGWSDIALAAEFKRASPSKGDIALELEIKDQAQQYASGGASMISVLTEPKWFKGSLDDMQAAREVVEAQQHRPAILRKDFIIDEYQLLEARAYGADCVLLIVAILTPKELTQLIEATHKLGMVPLVEVNSVEELDIALNANARLIGVNNRDLKTFKLDLDTTVRVADAIRARGIALGRDGVTLFALSGIHSRADVVKYETCGARGILVGEFLMKSGDVESTINKLLTVRRSSREFADFFTQPLAKICGVTKLEYAMAALRSGANLIGLIFVENSARCIDVEEAKKIVHAVRQYGERTGPVLPDVLEKSGVTSELHTNEWFQKNANGLRQVCSRSPLVVGVFVNKTAAEMNAVAEEVGLDIVQLHGDEGFDICKDINVPTIRVFHLPDTVNTDSVDAEAILQHVQGGLANFLLLDTSVKGQQGGTGVTFDWRIAALFNQARLPCLMAGGLTPENVSKAVSIAHPLCVDVSSGVEIKGSPGVKDVAKVSAFLKAVKDFLSVASLKIDEES